MPTGAGPPLGLVGGTKALGGPFTMFPPLPMEPRLLELDTNVPDVQETTSHVWPGDCFTVHDAGRFV